MTEKQKEGLEWLKDQLKDLTIKELDFWWLKDRNDSIFYYNKDKNLFFEYIPKFKYLHYDSYLWKHLARQFEFKHAWYDKIKEFIDGKSNQWRL